MPAKSSLEIEAKFAVPDAETATRLETADQLGGYGLSVARARVVTDTYLDTRDRTLLAAGYALRKRRQPERIVITLKGLGGVDHAVHRREEYETELPSDTPPPDWPSCELRERLLALIGQRRLEPLFDLRQTRLVRTLEHDGREVAELSIDDVHLIVEDREQSYRELEVELTPSGTEEDLSVVTAVLGDGWGLRPEPRSKFERAMAFLEQRTSTNDSIVSHSELARLQRIAARDDLYGRRAQAMLALDRGETQVSAGETAGMSERRVRHWLSRFRDERLGIFPQRVLEDAAAQSPQADVQANGGPSKSGSSPEPVPLDELLVRYAVDQAHAEAVARWALSLFDALEPVHGLAPERRDLLRMAAVVHNIGLERDPDRHHIAGRDILLAHPPAELDDAERLVVAITTFLHRKRITPKKIDRLGDGPFAQLSPGLRRETLVLSALVRLADGLDYAQTGTTELHAVRRSEGKVVVEVNGPYADVDASRADAKADLWRILFDTDVQFALVGPDAVQGTGGGPETVEAGPEPLPELPGLTPDDTMAEAARKTLYFHFQRMLAHERGTRLGEDIEELHDMRVATRRMRAALQVFGDYLDMGRLEPFLKGLRRTGRILGAVRDLDVFWEKTQAYLDRLPPKRQDELAPLQAVWQDQRESSRERMLAYLSDERYSRFTLEFGEFLQSPGAAEPPPFGADGHPRPRLLPHVVPVVVYQRLAAVRAYDEWVTAPEVPLERLHQLRIAAKGLRYTFEFFQEVLGPEAADVINRTKQLQDHLGDLQDAVVACNLLRDFLTWGTWGPARTPGKRVTLPDEPIVAPGVAAYLAARQQELRNLLDTFPTAWKNVPSRDFGQEAAAALSEL
jgi:CHAD domain-containing protein